MPRQGLWVRISFPPLLQLADKQGVPTTARRNPLGLAASPSHHVYEIKAYGDKSWDLSRFFIQPRVALIKCHFRFLSVFTLLIALSVNCWVCQDFETGKDIWHEKGIGKGSLVYADGLL